MTACPPSPIFVTGVYNLALDALQESGVEERFNNAVSEQSLFKLEEAHYAGQTLLWAPLRAPPFSEASPDADRKPVIRQQVSYDARGASRPSRSAVCLPLR